MFAVAQSNPTTMLKSSSKCIVVKDIIWKSEYILRGKSEYILEYRVLILLGKSVQ